MRNINNRIAKTCLWDILRTTLKANLAQQRHLDLEPKRHGLSPDYARSEY